jgi:hypothetical protein
LSVEAAGVWEDPEACRAQEVGLGADYGLGFGERCAVGRDSQDGYVARAAGGDQGLEALAAFPEFGGG